MSSDRLPSTMLVADEVISELRLDHNPRTGATGDKATGLRRLKYLRNLRRIDCIRIGQRTYIYPRAGVERFKRQNLMEAAQ
jgi:hypothetical protein